MRIAYSTCGACLAVFGLLVIAAPMTAEARIQCQGNFQVSPYGLIATPYCEEQIARVAQSRGFNVSAAEVHTNPLKKVYLCQMIGFDNRLKGSCAGYGPDSFGRVH